MNIAIMFANCRNSAQSIRDVVAGAFECDKTTEPGIDREADSARVRRERRAIIDNSTLNIYFIPSDYKLT